VIQNGEIESVLQKMGVLAQDAVSHVVERAAPQSADALAYQGLGAFEHFACGAVW